MRILIVSLALGMWLVPVHIIGAQALESNKAGQQAQTTTATEAKAPRKIDKQEPKSQPKSVTLEEMLSQALRNNPDIRVAEAKLREAEEELNRVRMAVAQKVAAYQAEVAVKKTNAEEARSRYQMAEQLHQTNAIALDEFKSVTHKLEKAKSELAAVEAQLPYLVGERRISLLKLTEGEMRPPGTVTFGSGDTISTDQLRLIFGEVIADTLQKSQGAAPMHGDLPTRNILIPQTGGGLTVGGVLSGGGLNAGVNAFGQGGLQNLQQFGGGALDRATQGISPKMAEKIRKALDTPIRVNFSQSKGKDVLAYLQSQAAGLNILSHFSSNEPIDLNLPEPVLMGAIFQFLEDSLGWRFVIRDYGIVATSPNSVPPGAVELLDFWKHPPIPAPKSPEKKK